MSDFLIYGLLVIYVIASWLFIGWLAERLHRRAVRRTLRKEGVCDYSDPGRPSVAARSITRRVDAARSDRRTQVSNHAARQAGAGTPDVAAFGTGLYPSAQSQLSDETGYATTRLTLSSKDAA